MRIIGVSGFLRDIGDHWSIKILLRDIGDMRILRVDTIIRGIRVIRVIGGLLGRVG